MSAKDTELRMDLARMRGELLRAELSGQTEALRESGGRLRGVGAVLGSVGSAIVQHKGKLGLAAGLARKPWVRTAASGAARVVVKHPLIAAIAVGAAVAGVVIARRRKGTTAMLADDRTPGAIREQPGDDSYSAPSG